MDQAFLLSLVIQPDRIQQALQKEGCNWHLLYEVISNVILILKEQEKQYYIILIGYLVYRAAFLKKMFDT